MAYMYIKYSIYKYYSAYTCVLMCMHVGEYIAWCI